jgi:hypothetical protein
MRLHGITKKTNEKRSGEVLERGTLQVERNISPPRVDCADTGSHIQSLWRLFLDDFLKMTKAASHKKKKEKKKNRNDRLPPFKYKHRGKVLTSVWRWRILRDGVL